MVTPGQLLAKAPPKVGLVERWWAPAVVTLDLLVAWWVGMVGRARDGELLLAARGHRRCSLLLIGLRAIRGGFGAPT